MTDEQQYQKGLMQNLGKTQPYHYTGPKCVPGCKSFTNYETKHHVDCPFYPGSLSEIYDSLEATARSDEREKVEVGFFQWMEDNVHKKHGEYFIMGERGSHELPELYQLYLETIKK